MSDGTPNAETFRVTEEIVTNCDMGPGCGMIPLLKIVAIVAMVSFVIGLILVYKNDDQ